MQLFEKKDSAFSRNIIYWWLLEEWFM